MCEELALIHRSRLVFAGPVTELRARHRDRRHVRLLFRGDGQALRGDVGEVALEGEQDGWLELTSANGTSADELARAALRHGELRELRTVEPTLREIFLDEIGATAR